MAWKHEGAELQDGGKVTYLITSYIGRDKLDKARIKINAPGQPANVDP